MRNLFGLIFGFPDVCDRCNQEDSKITIELLNADKRNLCELCLCEVVSTGIEVTAIVNLNREAIAFAKKKT